MRVSELLSFIPVRWLEELANETKVDRYSKKLQGVVIFKLLLHCLLTQKQNSLRSMRSAYESLIFQFFNQGQQGSHIAISSISERLGSIEPTYFQKLYERCVLRYQKATGSGGDAIVCIDSTIVSLSTKLLRIGYQLKGGDAENYRQLKFTVAYRNGIAETVNFYTDQAHNSENLALRETMLQQVQKDKTTIKVFDRGVTARSTYDSLTEEGVVFVSVINPKAKHDKVQRQRGSSSTPIAGLQIIADDWCRFYGEWPMKARYLIRRIETIRLADGEPLSFITNTADLSALEVTELYKRRWEVEVFFRFLKQQLNFSHLLNRTDNGIRVVLYVTLIAGLLLEVFKRKNKLKGYKIPMQQFATSLEEELIKHLITISGGSVSQLQQLLQLNTS